MTKSIKGRIRKQDVVTLVDLGAPHIVKPNKEAQYVCHQNQNVEGEGVFRGVMLQL